MQRYTPLFNALLAAVPYLTREDLPKAPPAENEDLVCDWLFKHLGWYSESGEWHYADHQFMEYMEWKEPHLKLGKFYPIQKLGIEIDATGIDDEVCKRTLVEFCAHEGIPVPDDQGELEDLFESEEMEMFAMFNDSNYVLEAYDALLKPHGLRLIDIGYTENAFLLMVKDDDEAVGNVEQALIDLGYVDIEE
jgi:hypothetical protein